MCSETRLSRSSLGLSSRMKTKSNQERRAALIFKFSFTVLHGCNWIFISLFEMIHIKCLCACVSNAKFFKVGEQHLNACKWEIYISNANFSKVGDLAHHRWTISNASIIAENITLIFTILYDMKKCFQTKNIKKYNWNIQQSLFALKFQTHRKILQ